MQKPNFSQTNGRPIRGDVSAGDEDLGFCSVDLSVFPIGQRRALLVAAFSSVSASTIRKVAARSFQRLDLAVGRRLSVIVRSISRRWPPNLVRALVAELEESTKNVLPPRDAHNASLTWAS